MCELTPLARRMLLRPGKKRGRATSKLTRNHTLTVKLLLGRYFCNLKTLKNDLIFLKRNLIGYYKRKL